MIVADSKRETAHYLCPTCGVQRGGFRNLRRARRALEIHRGHKHQQGGLTWHRAGVMRYEGFDGDSLMGEIYKDADGWIANPNVELATFVISRMFATKYAAQRYVEKTYGRSSPVVLSRR